MVNRINADDESVRRKKLMEQAQEYMAGVDKNAKPATQVSEWNGKKVSVNSANDSKESRIYKNYAYSPKEDLINPDQVNKLKNSVRIEKNKS